MYVDIYIYLYTLIFACIYYNNVYCFGSPAGIIYLVSKHAEHVLSFEHPEPLLCFEQPQGSEPSHPRLLARAGC